MEGDIDDAVAALAAGDLVVYPTETVYGLGADALAENAVERVFAAKGRSRDEPISMAVPDLEIAREYTNPSARELSFMEAFLPGPVTIVLAATPAVPDVLTAGRDRVGIRIPDHDVALDLLGEFAPITATSANVSGQPSATSPNGLDARIRDAAAVVLDVGATPGGGSTVVDVSAGDIYRRGRQADAVADWLADH